MHSVESQLKSITINLKKKKKKKKKIVQKTNSKIGDR